MNHFWIKVKLQEAKINQLVSERQKPESKKRSKISLNKQRLSQPRPQSQPQPLMDVASVNALDDSIIEIDVDDDTVQVTAKKRKTETNENVGNKGKKANCRICGKLTKNMKQHLIYHEKKRTHNSQHACRNCIKNFFIQIIWEKCQLYWKLRLILINCNLRKILFLYLYFFFI